MNETKDNKGIFYGWWIVLGCVLVTSTMVPLIMALSNKYLLQVTGELNISRTSFTMANTIIQAIGIFLSPFVAKVLAGKNMKKFLNVSIVLFAISYASNGLATSVYHIYISSFFVGIFYLNSTMIPVSILVTNWFEEKRGLAMSIAMTGIGVGGVILSPLMTYFLDTFGWRYTYIIMGVIVLVVALPISLFIFKQKPEDIGLKPYGQNEGDIKNKKNESKGRQEEEFKPVSLSVKESRTKAFYWMMMLGMLANTIINSGSLGQFPPAIEELHGPALQATIISLYSLIGIGGKIILGWINDNYGLVKSTIYGCVLFGLSFVFMLMGDNKIFIYLMAIVFGLGNAIGTITPPLITAAIFGPEKYGEAYGQVNSVLQVGLAIGSLFVASIFDMTGSYQVAWIVLLALTGVTMVGWIGALASSRKYVDGGDREEDVKYVGEVNKQHQ